MGDTPCTECGECEGAWYPSISIIVNFKDDVYSLLMVRDIPASGGDDPAIGLIGGAKLILTYGIG